MHLENMQPSSLVKEKGIFIVNGLNTWYPFPCNAMVYISYMHTCFQSIHINYFCEIV